MPDRKKLEKAARALNRLLSEVLLGETTLDGEADLLSRLGVELTDAFRQEVLGLRAQLEANPLELKTTVALAQSASSTVLLAFIDALAVRSLAEPLLRLREVLAGREEQKAIGAALHRLESHGVFVQRETTAPASSTPRVPPPPEAFLVPRDPYGNCVLTVFVPGDLDEYMIYVTLDELDGIGELALERDHARSSRRELRREIDRHAQLEYFEITPAHAFFLLEEGCALARAQHRPIPLELSQLLHQLRDTWHFQPKQSLPRGIDGVRPIWGQGNRGVSPLLARPEVLSWHVDVRHIRPIFQSILETLQSGLAVSESARRERVQALIQEGVANYFTPERRKRYVRRLEDVALYFDRVDMPDLCRIAWGSALALRDESIPAQDIPFAWSFLEVKLAMFMSELYPGNVGFGSEEPPSPPPEEPPPDPASLIYLPQSYSDPSDPGPP